DLHSPVRGSAFGSAPDSRPNPRPLDATLTLPWAHRGKGATIRMPRIWPAIALGIVAVAFLAAVIVGHVAFHARNQTVRVTLSHNVYDTNGDRAKWETAGERACARSAISWIVGSPSKAIVIVTHEYEGRKRHRTEVIPCSLYHEVDD